MATGAVIAGRGTFDPAHGWGGDHHNGAPIYILSRHPAPAWASNWPLVHYDNDLAVAMSAAKRVAGDRNVLVHGAGIAQRALKAGLLDELEIHLVPCCWVVAVRCSTTWGSNSANWSRCGRCRALASPTSTTACAAEAQSRR